jgi:hypothetical protein
MERTHRAVVEVESREGFSAIGVVGIVVLHFLSGLEVSEAAMLSVELC